MSWTDEQFLAEVQGRFGFRLGRFLKAGQRRAYPLSLSCAERSSVGPLRHRRQCRARPASRSRAWGSIWGLRDVASLAELIAELRATTGRRRRCAVRRLACGRSSRGHRASPMGWCVCLQVRGDRCGGCGTWDSWRSTCCPPRRPPVGALDRRGRLHSEACARRTDSKHPTSCRVSRDFDVDHRRCRRRRQQHGGAPVGATPGARLAAWRSLRSAPAPRRCGGATGTCGCSR